MPRISLREAAYAAIADRLTVALPDVPVERNRRSLLNDGEAPRLVLRDGAQQPNPDGASEDHITLDALLEGHVEAADDEIGAAISDLAARAVEALTDGPVILGAMLEGEVQVELYILEGRMEVEVLTVSDSRVPVGAFYLDLSFDIRVPAGTRFLETP